MTKIERWPERTWYALVCPRCGKQRDLFCHDHGEPVKIEAVEVVPTDQHRGVVEERDCYRTALLTIAEYSPGSPESDVAHAALRAQYRLEMPR